MREGFTHVLGSVAVGKVGALAPSIEAARLCRTHKDWRHVLELCQGIGHIDRGCGEEKQLSKNAVSRLVDGQSDDFKRGGTGI